MVFSHVGIYTQIENGGCCFLEDQDRLSISFDNDSSEIAGAASQDETDISFEKLALR